MIEKYLLRFTNNNKTLWLVTGLCAFIFLTSGCHFDQGEVKIPTNKVLVLKFDEESKDFSWGREYLY